MTEEGIRFIGDVNLVAAIHYFSIEFLIPSEGKSSRVVFTLKGLDLAQQLRCSIRKPPVYEVYRMSLESRERLSGRQFGVPTVERMPDIQAFPSMDPSQAQVYCLSDQKDVLAAFYFPIMQHWRLVDFFAAMSGRTFENGDLRRFESETNLCLLEFHSRHMGEERTSRAFM